MNKSGKSLETSTLLILRKRAECVIVGVMRKLLPTSGFLSICPSDVMMKKLVSFDYSAKIKRFREVIHRGHVSGRGWR